MATGRANLNMAAGLLSLALLLAVPASAPAGLQPVRRYVPVPVKAKLKAYPTPYYVIHTDLKREDVREAALRMTCMAREYQKRTRGFGRRVRQRLPFYLFSSAEDYRASGGLPGSSGMYLGDRLMAVVGRDPDEGTWRVIQHEGFHQYVHKVLSRRIPVWVNEGMAEYFGHGIWAGDSYVVGVIPPRRLKQLKSLIKTGKILPFLKMLEMSGEQWQSSLTSRNYTQAWAMVHFLAHGEDGKYQDALNGFLRDIAEGRMSWKAAFVRRFGRDVEAFEKRFSEWWLSLPADPTADLYNEAVVRTLTSFFARAYGQGQRFDGIEEFFKAARDGSLKQDRKLWLPRTLLAEALKKSKKLGEWKLVKARGGAGIKLATPQGTGLTGTFRIKPGSAVTVSVEIDRDRRPPENEGRVPPAKPGRSN